MATPDLSTLTSSAQVFSANHTLPQIRAIHKALHAEIDDKAARLRTQVGGSYRELLGTADNIVQMRKDMDAVQTTLARMGGRCGRAIVSGKVTGLANFMTEREDYHTELPGASLGAMARARLLDACVLSAGKLLRSGKGSSSKDAKTWRSEANIEGMDKTPATKGDRLVVAAKICVLGRLLVKSFSDDKGAATGDNITHRATVKAADKNLNTLRQRLLRSINSVLANVNEKKTAHQQQSDVLKALSAYSLHTNSGASDVLRHFLNIRARAMALAFEVADPLQEESSRATRNPKDVLKCLSLYTKTLQDVQALVPNKLTDALAALKKSALLTDGSLRAIEGLRLDVYERWCGDEIQYFTPFIRHDDLDGKQAREMLFGWAREEGDLFLRELAETVNGMSEFKSVVELRTSVLRLWIAESGKVRGFDPSVIQDRIRDVVNGHMLRVLETKVHKLRLVGSEASAALAAWREGTTDQHAGLWGAEDTPSFDMDLSRGAAQFTQDVVARLYGRNDAVNKAVASYKSWFRVIDDVGQVVEQLRRQRWDNDVDGEIEDEETIEHRQQLLARDDPQKLSAHLSVSLVKAFKDLDDQLAALWSTYRQNSPNRGQMAMYLLRLLRDVRGRLPDGQQQQQQQQQGDQTIKAFGLASVPSLHEALVEAVIVSPVDEFATSALARRTVVGRSLWEKGAANGAASDLELPTSPSPGIFRFLRSLSASMGDAGGDLWSPAAVAKLKQNLREQLCKLWREAVGEVTSPVPAEKEDEKTDAEKKEEEQMESEEGGEEKRGGSANGESVAEEDKDKEEDERRAATQKKRDLLIQWLFDIHYLGYFLSGSSLPSAENKGEKDEFTKLERFIYEKSGLDSTAASDRLVKSSHEYWKRTNLLFGLLS